MTWGPRTKETLLSLPSMVWLIGLFLVPTLLVFAISFRPSTPFGGVGEGWTLETIRGLANPNYPTIIWRTVWISLSTTAICLTLAVPCAYFMARAPVRWRSFLVMLVIIPFWTNFLIRIFAWKIMLHPEGLLKKFLLMLHLVEPRTILMYNEGAVLLVLVYSYLSFAILPIYAATEKFDFGLLEAAQDLGATRLRALVQIFLPGISRGMITAALVVFIPALGSYVIPEIVGGPSSEMIGNKIAQRVFVDRNLPHASGLSALLTLAVVVPMLLVLMLQRRSPSGLSKPEGRA
ncbi:MAG: ABC transporter permease [Verrucomicrobia bacterium]|nr:ABC transporter permease [Verrucomicrobiota bacterium]